MESKIQKLFSIAVIRYIKSQIEDAGGNEVFFSGEINSSKVLTSCTVGSRGDEHSVVVNQEVKRKGSVLIHNHPGGNLRPSGADLSVASQCAENCQGFYIVNNDVTDVYVVVEPVLPKILKPVDSFQVSTLLSKQGPLAQLSDSFEERPSQIELAEQIAEAFNGNKIAAFEAGTGVGKSFAYLIPALMWASQNDQRVVVSTGTINLQQQLCEKDIPLAEKITGTDVKFMLIKGRQNYICKRRLADTVAQKELFDDNEILDRIIEWERTSDTGSKSELSFMPPNELWSKINSESDACMGMRCPFHSQCFVMKVRKEASSANLLVVNHHLLFADIESRMHGAGYDDAAVLPPYRRIVFDEAHGIEAAATSFFSESFNRFKIMKQINLLYRKKKNMAAGFLFNIAILSSNEEKASDAYDMIQNIKNSLVNLEMSSLDLLANESTFRLNSVTARVAGPLISLCQTLAKEISIFTGLVLEVLDGVSDEDKEVPSYFETKVIAHRLQDYCVILQDFSQWDEKNDKVFWFQKKLLSPDAAKEDDSRWFVNFTETPVDIAPLMNNGVYEPMENVICTSATLKTGTDFNYWMRRTGFYFSEKNRISTGEFLSPFPYKQNMIFAVPRDIPLPDDVNFQNYVDAALVRFIKASKGRTLVLFTSYDSLKISFNSVSAALKLSGISFLRQGQDDNSRLLDTFRKDVSSVLFATDSFWQGVDVPGESLSQVIMVKLPFTVPNDPVFKARSDDIVKKGGNAFMELSVPEAVIKFRQGAGRLMRRGSDRGFVITLDRRLYEKQYGRVFLSSLPDCKMVYDSVNKICEMIENFI